MRDPQKPLTMHDRARLARALRGWTLYGREGQEWREIGPRDFYGRKRLGLRVRKVRRLPEEPDTPGPPPFHALLEQMGLHPAEQGFTVIPFTAKGLAKLQDAIEDADPDDLWAD